MKTLSDEKQELSPREKFSLDIPLESNKYIYYRKEDVKEFIKDILDYIKIKDDLLIQRIKQRAGKDLI